MSPYDEEPLTDLDDLCSEVAKWVDAMEPSSTKVYEDLDRRYIFEALDAAFTELDKARDAIKEYR